MTTTEGFCEVPAELLARHATESDQIYVKYEDMESGVRHSGGLFMYASPGAYMRLRSTWKRGDSGQSVIFSVQINEDTRFFIRDYKLQMLTAKDAFTRRFQDDALQRELETSATPPVSPTAICFPPPLPLPLGDLPPPISPPRHAMHRIAASGRGRPELRASPPRQKRPLPQQPYDTIEEYADTDDEDENDSKQGNGKRYCLPVALSHRGGPMTAAHLRPLKFTHTKRSSVQQRHLQ